MPLYRVRFDTYGLMCDDHKEYRWENVKPGPWVQMVQVHGSGGTCWLREGYPKCRCPITRRHITEFWCNAESADHATVIAMLKYGKEVKIRWVRRGLDPRTPSTERKWNDFVTQRQIRRVNEVVQRVHHGSQGNGNQPQPDPV